MTQDCTNCVHIRLVTSEDTGRLFFAHCVCGKAHVAWLKRDKDRMRPKTKEIFDLKAAWGICRGSIEYWEKRDNDTPVRRIPVRV